MISTQTINKLKKIAYKVTCEISVRRKLSFISKIDEFDLIISNGFLAVITSYDNELVELYFDNDVPERFMTVQYYPMTNKKKGC